MVSGSSTRSEAVYSWRLRWFPCIFTVTSVSNKIIKEHKLEAVQSSPDLTAKENFLNGTLKQKVKARQPKTATDLKPELKAEGYAKE